MIESVSEISCWLCKFALVFILLPPGESKLIPEKNYTSVTEIDRFHTRAGCLTELKKKKQKENVEFEFELLEETRVGVYVCSEITTD